jgi:hypothetical protein
MPPAHMLLAPGSWKAPRRMAPDPSQHRRQSFRAYHRSGGQTRYPRILMTSFSSETFTSKRYRHVDACAAFKAAKPAVTPWKNPGDGRVKGESYKTEAYDDLVPQILDRVRVGAMTMTQVVAGLDTHPDTTFTIARIERDREGALAAYRRDRNIHALQQAMDRLDAEEAGARASTKVVSAVEAVAWLHDLPALWTAADDTGRRLLTEAIFEKVEVLGVQSVTIHPTPEADAHGWSDAFGSLPLLLDAGRASSTVGRGERSQTSGTDLFVPAVWRLAVRVG